MASAAYVSNQVAVTSTAALVLTVPSASGSSGVLLLAGDAGVFVGGVDVTADNGFAIPAGTIVTIPTNGAESHDLYAVASSDTTLSYLYPVA